MRKSKSKLARRITWRVVLIMVVFNVLILGVIVKYAFNLSLVNSAMRGQYVMDGIGEKMETMLQMVGVSATNNVAEVEANLGSPQSVYEALEKELRLNPHYRGCFVAFEPDYYQGEGHWFEPYVRFADSTHVERKQMGSEQYDYFKEEWYQKGLQADSGYLSDPYHGENALVCSYVLPIHDGQGSKVGVYGIVMDIDWLEKTVDAEGRNVRRMEFFEDFNGLDDAELEHLFTIQVVDSKGKKIVGTDSLDTKLLKGEQEEVMKGVTEGMAMQDLKNTEYYVNAKPLAHTNWTLVVWQHNDMVYMLGLTLTLVMLFVVVIGGIIIFFTVRHSIHRATKPLAFLSESAQEVAKGNFDTPLPEFKHKDEITQLRNSFDTMQQSLKRYVEELKASTAAKATIESELNVAHSIQMSMLPKTFPPFPDRKEIDLYGMLKPAKAVGGDLYDFFIHNEKLFFCIGDVSGKGVPASLVMAVSRTLFRNIAMHVDKPSHIASTMNANICTGNDEDMFVTLFIGVLDLQTGHLSYCNAGHNAPLILHADTEKNKHEVSMMDCTNPNLPVGVMAGWNYTEQELVMSPGTTLFLYTDGLTEAENAVHDQFGEERLMDVFNALAAEMDAPQQLTETMNGAVHQFVGDTEQSDDLTMLAIQYKKCTTQFKKEHV